MDVVVMTSTIILSLLTAAYVVLTARISRDTSAAAASAEKSSIASQIAAEAASKSALVAEAQLPISFEISWERFPDGRVWITLQCNSSRLVVWDVKATLFPIVSKEKMTIRLPVLVEFRPPRSTHNHQVWPEGVTDDFPRIFESGESSSLEWPDPAIGLSDDGCAGLAFITFSLTHDSERRTVSITTESAPGLARVLSDARNVPKLALDQ